MGDTALAASVVKGHLHVAEILVKNGADVNYRNKVSVLIPVTQVHSCQPYKKWMWDMRVKRARKFWGHAHFFALPHPLFW